MIPSGLSPQARLLALARATPRSWPAGTDHLPLEALDALARKLRESDPPERIQALTGAALELVRAGTNPLLQWDRLWQTARRDWLNALLNEVLAQEALGIQFRTRQGETVLHWLARKSELYGRPMLSWPSSWVSQASPYDGDLPLHAVWHPRHGVPGRIAKTLRCPADEHWNAYERLGEAIETSEKLLLAGASWEDRNAHGEPAKARFLAAVDAGVFRWLPNDAAVAWLEPVMERLLSERRQQALDQTLPPATLEPFKPRF